MTVESTLASWLRDGLLRHIDFHVGALRIHQPLFHEVATAVAQRRVPIATVDGADGEYESASDAMRLPRSDGGRRQRFRALLAHEAVHAWCDIHRMRMDFYDEEAAGYITQVWLLMLRDRGDDLNYGSAPANAVINAAWHIVQDNDLHNTRGVRLTRSHIEDLRATLRGIPMYRSMASQYPNTEHHDGLIRPPPDDCGFLGCW